MLWFFDCLENEFKEIPLILLEFLNSRWLVSKKSGGIRSRRRLKELNIQFERKKHISITRKQNKEMNTVVYSHN